jgi:RNA recognition motif-containing protein
MQPQDPLVHVNKPNPYVIVETKDELDDAHRNDPKEKPKEVVYKYPKSKIFVGGLDFKLTNQDLQQHFSQYGAIESAVILKNINNGQSRGFGFVTFKDEAVAQDLIQNMQTTNIFGRKVDIKSAEPKQ